MSLKVWKTLHVQKQTRSNVSSHRDTRMGNATVWLTTMQSFVENFAAICFWDYAQQSAMCAAPQHHVATSRCKILFDRLVVKKLFDPASPEANRLSVGNLQIMKCNTLTQRKHCFQTVWCCLPLVLRWALNCKQLLLDFLLGPQWTLSCVTQGLLVSSSHAVRGSTQTEATHANRMSSRNQRLYTKKASSFRNKHIAHDLGV